MKIKVNEPPRVFNVGADGKIQLHDCGQVQLCPDEQVTFVTLSGTEYDVCRKEWGYYATPSLNNRLPSFNLRPALVESAGDRFYIMLVEKKFQDDFLAYLKSQDLSLVSWLDDTRVLKAMRERSLC